MNPHQAPQGASVPRALTVLTSYYSRPAAASDDPSSLPKITDETARRTWLDQGRVGDALVRAARRTGRRLEASLLVAAANLGRWVTQDVIDDVLSELVAAGRLLAEDVPHPRSPLFARIRLYSAPREGGRP